MNNNNDHPSSSRTILYIEDDPANRQLVSFIIARRTDLQLIEADTGLSGIELAVSTQPAVILLDLSLPDTGGYEVLKQLQEKSTTSHIPVVAVSGDYSPEDVERGMAAGMHGYLSKPVKVNELYSIIDRIIAIPG